MSEKIMEIMSSDERIIEMVYETSRLNVPVHPSVDIDIITMDDPDPRFVNVEVIRSGMSGNNRRYTGQVIKQLSDMVPGCHGFLGHPDPSKHGFEFREPQCIFVGSMLDTMQDGSVRIIAKAYIFKSSDLREWIPKSIAANNPMTVSINAMGDIARNGDIIEVLTISDLQSIDWANPGTEGIETSKAINIVREMGGSEKMDTKEIIKNTTVTEFKAYNPDGYNGIVSSITITELMAQNPVLFQQIEDSARITEMNIVIGDEPKTIKLTELQGVITDLEAKINSTNEELTKIKLTEFKNSKINELVPSDMIDKISPRITGTDEASIEASINSELAYVREMMGIDKNEPIKRQKSQGTDDLKDIVAGMFGSRKESK